MSKFSKIITITWIVLALISFVSGFYLPLFTKVINVTFGALNMIMVLTCITTAINNVRIKNKINQLLEEENGLSVQEEESKEASGK